MTYDAEELKQYPEIMNKEQLRKVCHISKRTAHYLLQFNLIPHVCTGKKTHCYAIKKRDVIDFMINREINPSRYIVGENKLRELMDCGELEYIQNGNRRLIADAAIWDWYHRAKTTAKPPARQGG